MSNGYRKLRVSYLLTLWHSLRRRKRTSCAETTPIVPFRQSVSPWLFDLVPMTINTLWDFHDLWYRSSLQKFVMQPWVYEKQHSDSLISINELNSHFPYLSWPISVKFGTRDLHIMQLSNLSFVKTDAVQAIPYLVRKWISACFDWGEIWRRKSVQNTLEHLRVL